MSFALYFILCSWLHVTNLIFCQVMIPDFIMSLRSSTDHVCFTSKEPKRAFVCERYFFSLSFSVNSSPHLFDVSTFDSWCQITLMFVLCCF
jgi:hypothetical protein